MKILPKDIKISWYHDGYDVFYKNELVHTVKSIGRRNNSPRAEQFFKEEAEVTRNAILNGFIIKPIKQRIKAIQERELS